MSGSEKKEFPINAARKYIAECDRGARDNSILQHLMLLSARWGWDQAFKSTPHNADAVAELIRQIKHVKRLTWSSDNIERLSGLFEALARFEGAKSEKPDDVVGVPNESYESIQDKLATATQSAVSREVCNELIWEVRHQLAALREKGE